MLNLKFLRNYILKNQKYSTYTCNDLEKLSEDGLKDIIYGMIVMNKL